MTDVVDPTLGLWSIACGIGDLDFLRPQTPRLDGALVHEWFYGVTKAHMQYSASLCPPERLAQAIVRHVVQVVVTFVARIADLLD